MAKAIKHINKSIPNKAEEQLQAIQDILEAIGENRDTIITTIQILKNLHEMGVLHAVQGLLENRNDVGEIAMEQINQPAMHNTIKNGINAVKFLGAINPDQMEAIFQGLTHGLERSSEVVKKGEQQSLWKLGTSLRDPDVKASLSTMIEFLHGMGEVFNDDERRVH